MQKVKTSTNTGSSSVRPATISSSFKHQKVETLNHIVNNLGQHKTQAIATQSQIGAVSLPEQRGGMGEQVLAVLKQKIKNNYDHLYNNYADNRTKIFKQIQTVQTNINGENAMNSKYQEILKEKGKYDKLKSVVQDKQRKLKKLIDLRTQLRQVNQVDIPTETKQQIQKAEKIRDKKEQVEHNIIIYKEMLRQRKDILLTLEKRQKQMTSQLQIKKQKTQKTAALNLKKRQQVLRLEQELSKQQQIQLPPSLAEELANKLEQYENKHSYNNIIHHEAILQQQRFQELKQNVTAKREQQRINKLKREKKEKQQMEELQNQLLIKDMQQQKIKSLFGVDKIEDAINRDNQVQREKIQFMSQNIESEIKDFQEANQVLQKELEQIVTKEAEKSKLDDISVEKIRQKYHEKELSNKILANELQKKQDLANHWQTIMHMMNNNQLSEASLDEFTSQIRNKQQCSMAESARTKIKHSKRERSQQTESVDLQ